MRPAPRCPRCGSTDTIPIVYGLPTSETGQAADRGEVEIGGCLVTDESHDRRCKACGLEFDELTEKAT